MLLEDLKQQTRHHHSRLEQLNSLPGCMDDYAALLARFHGFVAPWERRLAERVPAADALREGREKTAWLEADLARFGFDAARIAGLPRCDDLPADAGRAELLGACYVLEGSTLGGQFITRHLHEKLALTPGEGDRYFRSYGTEVGAKWQSFRAELMKHSSPENDPVIIRAAQETFEKLAAWFAASPQAAPA